MLPINEKDLRVANLAPGWQPVVYAKDQPQYLPLPALVRYQAVHGQPVAMEVVSVWSPDAGELALLKSMITRHDAGGPAPRISLMSYVFGDPLQPIRLTVGEFGEPYSAGAGESHVGTPQGI